MALQSRDCCDPLPDDDVLEHLEGTARRLARLAGEHIAAAFGAQIAPRRKRPAGGEEEEDVSEIDTAVERLLRSEIAARCPGQAVLGEEIDTPEDPGAGIVWILDPLDGTTNYLAGLPLFAASVGVACNGRPVAGAIWCAATHRLGPGVYHAHAAGPLCFDGEPLVTPSARADAPRVRSEPGGGSRLGDLGHGRVIASAASECAYVAAHLLHCAYIARPRIWDIAAGVVLVRSAGRSVWTHDGVSWKPLDGFRCESNAALRQWRQPLLLGDATCVEHAARRLA